MTKERFELTSGKDLMWTVKDNESGVKIEFREGLFNETQEVKTTSRLCSWRCYEAGTYHARDRRLDGRKPRGGGS